MDVVSLASVFKSLSEPVRLRVMALLLTQGELCVCELVDTLQLSQSVVSRHLAYLRHNQLVVATRKGAWMYYQINPNPPLDMKPIYQFIQQNQCNIQSMQIDQMNLKKSACGN